MNYSVVWKTAALDTLADFYVAVSNTERDRIAEGIELLNQQLSVSPFEVGESRDHGLRITFTPMAVVTFLIDPGAATVHVLHVSRYGR